LFNPEIAPTDPFTNPFPTPLTGFPHLSLLGALDDPFDSGNALAGNGGGFRHLRELADREAAQLAAEPRPWRRAPSLAVLGGGGWALLTVMVMGLDAPESTLALLIAAPGAMLALVGLGMVLLAGLGASGRSG
jgi:hypothetical protein